MKLVFTPLTWITRRKDGYRNFATTIGNRIYLPADWDERPAWRRYSLLRHEIVHVRQFHRVPFEILSKTRFWWINAVLFSLLYLFVLPVVRTYRAKFEREAYTQTLLVLHELKLLDEDTRRSVVDWIVQTFCTGTYAWMDTEARTRLWVVDTLRDIRSGKITNEQDNVKDWLSAGKVVP